MGAQPRLGLGLIRGPLGTHFPFPEFLPRKDVKTIQVDRNPAHLGRRAPLELGTAGDVQATLGAE